MIFAIDFDGTLATQERGRHPQLRPGAEAAIRSLARAGHELILHSCRLTRPYGGDDLDWMIYKERYVEMREVLVGAGIWTFFRPWETEGKPDADVYVDDRSRNARHRHFWVELSEHFGG